MTSLPSPAAPDDVGQQDACTRCGTAFSSGVRFCTICGTASPLAIATAEVAEEGEELASGEGGALRAAPTRSSSGRRASRIRVEEALRQSPLFSLLPSNARTELGSVCFRRRYEPGAWIVVEGQPGSRAFIVASGVANAYVGGGYGRRILVRPLQPGDFFGEPTPEGGPTRTVSVQAVTAVEVYVFPSERLFELAQAFGIFRDALEHTLNTSRIEVFLRRASPFAPLPPDVLVALAARMEDVSYDPGALVFSEGDEGDAFYIVRRGSVNVIAGGTQVASLRAGDCFGEAALLTHAPRTASIAADEPTQVFRLDRSDFDRINAEYEEVRGFFIELLRRRDLLTPRLARASGLTAPPLTSAADAAARVSFRPVRDGVALTGVVSALLLVLSLTPRGEYLYTPALVTAAAIAPLVAVLVARAMSIHRDLNVVRQATIVLVSALAGLLVLQVRSGAEALTSPLAREILTAALGVAVQTVMLLALSRRRGFRLEMDGLVAGATIGWGFGLASLLTTVVNTVGGGVTLKVGSWANVMLLPMLFGLLGAHLGVAVWAAGETQRRSVLAGAVLFAATLAFFSGLPAALNIPLLIGVPLLVGLTGIALLRIRRRLRPAIIGRAAALITLGLSGILAASSGLAELINCRGCGAPAPAGAVYCARCGLSLVEDE